MVNNKIKEDSKTRGFWNSQKQNKFKKMEGTL
jgi:hypothetical protein